MLLLTSKIKEMSIFVILFFYAFDLLTLDNAVEVLPLMPWYSNKITASFPLA